MLIRRNFLSRKFSLFSIIFLSSISSSLYANESTTEESAKIITNEQKRSTAVLRFTLLDAPYNLRHGYTNPSMSESLNIARSWHTTIHYSLERLLPPADSRFKIWLNQLAAITTDALFTTLPLSPAWTHEEWHRAVMTHRGISSHNTINNFKLFQDSYAVDSETDEDLIRLKKRFPKDQLRLSIAGNESEHEFVLSLEKDRFYLNQNTIDFPMMLLTQIGAISYLSYAARGYLDDATLDWEKDEGTDVSKRDFIGADFTGWVRDLYRPDEPFEARGTHPSGIGVRRYTRTTDLTSEEKSFLRKQSNLHLLNLVDPQLFGFDSFSMTSPTTGRELGWNASLAHYLTPFGYALRANVFLKTVRKETPFGTQGVFFAYQQNVNRDASFPQLEAEHRPIPVGDSSLGVGARVMIWLQPKDLNFFAKKPEIGGLVGTRLISLGAEGIQPWVEIEGKTKGWVAGNVDLGETYALRAGIEARLQ